MYVYYRLKHNICTVNQHSAETSITSGLHVSAVKLRYMDTKCYLQVQKKENGVRFSNDLILF